MDVMKAVQPAAFENLSVIPSDLSARNADILLSEMKQNKKKLSSLLSSVKKVSILSF